MEIVGTFDDGLDVSALQHNRVDAIFLDINIPSLDGVLLAQNISQFAHKPFIVFITAWKEHAVKCLNCRRLTTFSNRIRSHVLPGCCKTGSGLATTADQQYACRDGRVRITINRLKMSE
ncbi:response regulator [Shigella flexneri]